MSRIDPQEEGASPARSVEPGPKAAFALTFLSILVAAAGIAIYCINGSHPRMIIDFELAGSASAAMKIVAGSIGAFRSDLLWDSFLILGYSAGIAGTCFMGSKLFLTFSGRRVASAAAGAGLAAGLFDVCENVLLLWGLPSSGIATVDWQFQAASVFASVKFAFLAFSLPVALTSAVIVFKRTIRVADDPMPYEDLIGKVSLPWPVVSSTGSRWPHLRIGPVTDAQAAPAKKSQVKKLSEPISSLPDQHRYAYLLPEGREPAEVGICLSGGGIRSASVALGAFQSLRSVVQRARYLVAVSGGGYTAGALQLGIYPGSPNPQTPATIATPVDIFESGSVEEAHVRRHGDYIAGGSKEWLGALAAIFRGLLGSLLMISATIITIGLTLSYFYEAVGFIDTSVLARFFTDKTCVDAPCPSPMFPDPAESVRLAAVWTTVAAIPFLVAAAFMIDTPSWRGVRSHCRNIARGLIAVSGLLALLTFVVPAVSWGATYVTYLARQEHAGTEGAVAGVSGTLLMTYIGALASIMWRKRTQVTGAAKKAGGLFKRGKKKEEEEGVTHALPTSFTQYLIVWGVLIMLALMGLLLLGITVVTGTDWNGWAQMGIPLGLLLAHAFIDQTWMSLHPFYRRRLASAFSVRRVRAEPGSSAARAYDFNEEGTPLSTYGERQKGFPQVIFACAANLSGSDRTPPGRRAVSYTLSHDFIGGSDVGFASTRELEESLSGPLAADLTVQAAVAISGAAFASAMGGQAKAFQTLLAISNARLGTWLPNPVYVDRLAYSRVNREWWLPRLPRIRRLTYLLREIFGRFPYDNRLLLVTDGGHYDNLGLVELLRHRVRNIYCIDASGDSPPFPETLFQAITLARQELGIEITFPDYLGLVPGSAAPLEPEDPLKSLSARLSATPVIEGVITYPEAFAVNGKAPSNVGRLIFAKALLTPDMPTEVMAYAHSNAIFPRDSTSDQWFNHDQFDAYQALGRYIGMKALEQGLKPPIVLKN